LAQTRASCYGEAESRAAAGAPKACRREQTKEQNMDQPKLSGSGLGTVIRLVLLSIVVGIVLSALNIRPRDLFFHLQRFVDFIYSLGFGAIEWAVQYFLLGAVIVVPIWLISRVFSGLGSRRNDGR
jgi:hypothetical protein